MIASALTIGISKRELFEDYYFDEIGPVLEAWNKLHSPDKTGERVEDVSDPMAFLKEGAELVGFS